MATSGDETERESGRYGGQTSGAEGDDDDSLSEGEARRVAQRLRRKTRARDKRRAVGAPAFRKSVFGGGRGRGGSSGGGGKGLPPPPFAARAAGGSGGAAGAGPSRRADTEPGLVARLAALERLPRASRYARHRIACATHALAILRKAQGARTAAEDEELLFLLQQLDLAGNADDTRADVDE